LAFATLLRHISEPASLPAGSIYFAWVFIL